MSVWFFFSYARQDRDDRLDRFYQDLYKNVRLAKQLAEDEAAFFDQRSIEVGDVWTEKLRDGLRTARVLVSICSPTYLSRESCGKELQACLDRVPAGAQSTAIFPIVWGMPAASAHSAFDRFQMTHDDLTRAYKDEGLYYIMGLKKHEDDYAQFVTKLARMIVEAGENRPLLEKASLAPFEQIRNPFVKAPKGAGTTFKNAMFSYVVAQKDELPASLAERYGDEGKEWRPFHPDCPDPAGIMAMEVAAKQKLFYKDLPLDAKQVERIREAEEKKEVVIIVVDPHSIRVKTYQQYMRSYDKNNFDNSAVLVAWNRADGATDQERKRLRDQLADTFRHHAGGKKSIYYVDSISTDRDFRGTISKTIVKLRNSLIQASGAQQDIDDPALVRRTREAGFAYEKHPIAAGPGEAGR